MRLRIEHTTIFEYDRPISEAYTEMRLRPLDSGGQHVLSFSLHTEPRDEVFQYNDRFGNDVRHFDVIQPHDRLVVDARSDVLTGDGFSRLEESLSPLDEFDYLMATDYAPITPEIAVFAAAAARPGMPEATALNLMHAVHAGMAYEKGATDVTTTADQALALGRGVCQDFTHLMLAACRSQGIPARYVSGYLLSQGHDSATHAWVDVYLHGKGWRSLDPTHNYEQGPHYVRIATGRDYADVPPTRGVFVGSAKERMTVTVKVQAV